MKKARYIVFEGVEGCGKTTQVAKLAEYLKQRNYSVLVTKEPGSPHIPLTQTLRSIMLDAQYEQDLTVMAREFLSLAIRSIHIEKLITPALEKYDFIIQDRGILSCLAYGNACGVPDSIVSFLNRQILDDRHYCSLYDDVVYLSGSVSKGLSRAAAAKQEFAAGDAIESRGVKFLETVEYKMNYYLKEFNNSHVVLVDDKDIDQVFESILDALNLRSI